MQNKNKTEQKVIENTNAERSSVPGLYPPMHYETFKRFSEFIYAETGIQLPDTKRTMLQSRLQKRLRTIGLNNYDEYCDYIFSPEGMENEFHHMINRVTTNKTDFFREPKHFEYLVNNALPELIRTEKARSGKKLRFWSAASSTGEESYTLAMVLSDFAEKHNGLFFSILATDISTDVLNLGIHAVYDESRISPVPVKFRNKYLLRSKDKRRKLVRIVPELRKTVTFQHLNLMDRSYDIREPMDVIFCRNVIIYFDKPTKEKVLNNLCRYLNPGGYMFMGHSETLNGLNVPLKLCASTVYRKY